MSIKNKTGGVLLGQWFNGRLSPSDRILVDDCGELPCNPTGIVWPRHGPTPPGPPGPPGPPAPPAGDCAALLASDCPKAKYPSAAACAVCAGLHAKDLAKAHCGKNAIEKYCE